MAILNKGHDFSDGDQVTAAKLDSAVDSATFAAGSVDNASTQLSGGAIVVKDSGVTAAKIASGAITAVKLASNAVTTDKILDANVTTSKIADDSVTTSKILDANITADKILDASITTGKILDANVTFAKMADVIDDDTMATATNTNLPTSESIKAYVDTATSSGTYNGGESITLPSGLIMKFGSVTASISGTSVSFGEEFTNGVVSALACPNNGATLTQSAGYSGKAAVDSLTTLGMNVSCDGSAYWQAIGY